VIESLRITNLAVVEEVEIGFGPGLHALTGETGAGKSIVLGALALLAGGRATADAVRDGADEARVEAVFRTDRAPDLEAALCERGLDVEDHSLIVARSVSREGRSRAWVAGRLVPVSVLAELLGERIEISSQHESQSLRRPESHGRLLDAFGGLLAVRERVERGHAALRAVHIEHARLEAEADERARRRDFVAFQLGELDAAALTPGEFETLAGDHARLVHASELRTEASAAAAVLAGDPLQAEDVGAVDRVDAAARRLEPLAELDAMLRPQAERLRAAAAELADAARDLERYADGVEVDPERLAAVEERLALLERLRRKYGRSEDELFACRDRFAAELATLSGGDERARALRAEAAQLHARLGADAAELSAGRAKAAAKLGRTVEESLARLDLPGARLEVALDALPAEAALPCGPSGAEQVEFRFSANPGEAPRALRRVASGGELSRIFLALKNALRSAEAGSVLVFDEVDAGIGGRAADRVGALLAELGAAHQVLCITHWPQIAAAATAQLRVVKRTLNGRTTTAVVALDAEERVEELARMAGGARVGEATRAHARDLLAAGSKRRKTPRAPTPPPAR
jgi:DNA repair protein RecN (Recombination protein N)